MTCASFAHATPLLPADGRSNAMGGVGVASGVKAAPLNNPAMLAYGVEFIDWYVAAPAMTQYRFDPGQFKKSLNNFQDAAAALSTNPDAAHATAAQDALMKLRDKSYIEDNVISVFATIPSNVVGGGAFFTHYTYTSVHASVGTPDVSNPTAPVYNATLQKRGVSVIEDGASVAQVFNTDIRGFDTLAIGISPKVILWRASEQNEAMTSASTNVRFSGAEQGSAFDFDIGILKEMGRFSNFGLVIRNALPVKMKYASGARESLNTQVRAGYAYERRTRSFEVDVDVVPNSGVGFEKRSRILSLGTELVLTHYLQFRAGLRQNLLGNNESLVSIGLGIGTDYTLDVAVVGGTDQFGATAQLMFGF